MAQQTPETLFCSLCLVESYVQIQQTCCTAIFFFSHSFMKLQGETEISRYAYTLMNLHLSFRILLQGILNKRKIHQHYHSLHRSLFQLSNAFGKQISYMFLDFTICLCQKPNFPLQNLWLHLTVALKTQFPNYPFFFLCMQLLFTCVTTPLTGLSIYC